MSVFFQCPFQKLSGNQPMAHSSLSKSERGSLLFEAFTRPRRYDLRPHLESFVAYCSVISKCIGCPALLIPFFLS